MVFMKKIFPAAVFSLLLIFSSCFARIDGTVGEGGSADLRLRVSIGPQTTALIHTLRSFMGGGAPDAPVLDGPAISRSLAAAPGIRAVSLKNTGPQALDGTISLSGMGDFLASGAGGGSLSAAGGPAASGTTGAGRFITFREGGGISSAVITLDRDSAPELIARLSAEAVEYLAALTAPAVTGEKMTKEEYRELVASIYGQPLSDEIAVALIQGSIEFPRPVKTVRGGTFSGTRAVFEIPLLDILVLETPLRYEITW